MFGFRVSPTQSERPGFFAPAGLALFCKFVVILRQIAMATPAQSKTFFNWFIPLLFIWVAYGCANVVSPTGGPRDEDPPEVIRSTPPNGATNFEGGQVRIFFNEFVRLHEIRQQMLISPPMESLPEVRIRGRSIVFEIEEDLLPETTYNFFFGDAIRDITEGNAIPNFQFVFSTGDFVDSLSLQGQVKNAFKLEPEEGVFVMMYRNIYDSVPYLERPVYLAKTDKEGFFTINNMADGEYLMFALRDNNFNFKYDLPDEYIAFLDSLVSPIYFEEVPETETDTVAGSPATETATAAETIEFARTEGEEVLQRDTLSALESALADDKPFYTLYLFQEQDTVQRVVSSLLVREGLIEVAFRIPFDTAYVREIRQPFDEPWHIPEITRGRDTLRLWFADTGRDSLFLEVYDRGEVIDTIRRATQPRQMRQRDADAPEPILNLTFNYSSARSVPYFRPVGITSETPIASIDASRVQLFANDSIPVSAGFYYRDAVQRTVYMEPMPEQSTPYRLKILPGAFTDIFGITNDTIVTRYTTTTTENYGSVIADLTLPHQDNQFILQLLDRGSRVLEEKVVYEDGKYKFPYLAAANYRLRLIDDINNNGKWDTGSYLEGRQPEKVYIFDEAIQVRENWDIEIPWAPRR